MRTAGGATARRDPSMHLQPGATPAGEAAIVGLLPHVRDVAPGGQVGSASPTRYVAPPTTTPARVISRPEDHHVRSVTRDLAAPTRKWATSEITAAATMATVPVVNMNGITGMIAPRPVLMPAAAEAWTGSPGCS